MARGVNKVIIVGNLGQDPEIKAMPNGSSVTNITVATSESWKDKQTGQPQERTEWHRIVFFNRLAEIAAQYLRKGSKVYLEGSLRTRKWQDQSGTDRYTTEIVSTELQMLGYKQPSQQPGNNQPHQQPGNNQPHQGQYQGSQPTQSSNQYTGSQPPQSRNQQPRQQQAPNNQPQQGYASSGPSNQSQQFPDYDDDIPF